MSRGSVIFLVVIILLIAVGTIWWLLSRTPSTPPVVVTSPQQDCLTPEFVASVAQQIQFKESRIGIIKGYADSGQLSQSLRDELADLENDVVILKRQLLIPVCSGGNS